MHHSKIQKLPKYLLTLGLLTLGFICLFVKLAFWQFARSDEKQNILDKTHSNNYIIPIFNLNQLSQQPEYTRVLVSGHFTSDAPIFLGNQFYQHKPGYHVIRPFLIDTDSNSDLKPDLKQIILINTGWIENPDKYLNKKIINNKQIQLTGIIKNSNNSQYIMGKNFSQKDSLYYLQRLDVNESELNTIYPSYKLANRYINLLDLDKTHGTTIDFGTKIDWQWATISPQKHYAYAIQWILLAITCFLLYSCLCYKTYKAIKVTKNHS
ncbi:MAG: SURF1 family protein [Gammaproteobacteria bacterium]|nr:SURF1 family protein [Gammaproteobacteria bacterium]